MIRDYFERKKIWLYSSPRHIGLAFIVLLVTTLCGLLGFVFAGVLFIALSASYISSEINDLLPFNEKERKTRFLTEVMLDLLCLSVSLLINIAFIVIRYRKLELFSHPIYVAVCFISYIIILAHFSIKAAEDSRNLEKCLADASVSKSVKIYETFIDVVKIVIYTGLFVCFITIITNGSFSDIAGIDNEFYKLGCISGILSGTILVIDMLRTIGDRNEYFHTV
ncbi:hypothetical protein [Agathobacter sp.]